MKPNSHAPRDPFNFENFHPQIDALPKNQELLPQSEQQNTPPRDPAIRQFLKRLFISLVIIGVAFGGVVSWGIAKLMDRAGLLDVPNLEEQQK